MDKNTEFTYVKVIECFEFDLLTHVTHNGKHYLKKLCDVTDKSNLPWTFVSTITETSIELIEDYMNGSLDMKTLLYSKPQTWLLTEKDVVLELMEIKTSDLPETYKIDDNVYHDKTLSPD